MNRVETLSFAHPVNLYSLSLKKNGPRYNFAINDPKNYTGNEMALKTLQT
jgi:hypothetical protein